MSRLFPCIIFLVAALSGFADGLQDNIPENVRRVPRLGIEVPEATAKALSEKLSELGKAIDALRATGDTKVQDLLPDVLIYHRAVDQALNHREFFKEREIDGAADLLEEGLTRAAALDQGRSPWTAQTGLVVRGFISDLDETVQPYGLVVPYSYHPNSPTRHRLDLWFHGRNESITENAFLLQRRSQIGQYAPEDTFVLHPFGRYSNAFKFAGETDVFEVMAEVKRRYRIDGNRVSVRGFSMGGAGCWQFAVHSSDEFFAANPGAGFSETPRFLESFQKQTLNPTWWEKKLWRLYDCDLWAGNLFHLPTIAYSGENDIQKQAADVMAEALGELGIELTHVIGPKMGHKIDPGSKALMEARMKSLASIGRRVVPARVQFTTYTLKYNRMKWLTVDGLLNHWEPGRVDARIVDDSSIIVVTENVTDLAIEMNAGFAPFDVGRPVSISVNGRWLEGTRPSSDRAFQVKIHQIDKEWRLGARPNDEGTLRKRHNLQGPIDDAFMARFIFVRPSRASQSERLEAWSDSELDRAIEQWRLHFRGDAIIKRDSEITEEDIASANLVLWGDPEANAVLGRIAKELPIVWGKDAIEVGEQSFSTEDHGLVMIYPNPLNPTRYVVLNSSFTYREFAYLNNARQVPMLPDWAIVDLKTPPDSIWPGKVVAADFFDENWELKQ